MQVDYLVDIFAEINSLNISMLRSDISWTFQETKSIQRKLKLWMNKIKAVKTASFSSLNALLQNENFSLTEVQDIIEEHKNKKNC